MLEGKGTVLETDMPETMVARAMWCASQALDIFDVVDCRSIAAYIKLELDKKHGAGWQCVVGSNFGGFFTHKKGTFLYFSLEKLHFLIFKAAAAAAADAADADADADSDADASSY